MLNVMYYGNELHANVNKWIDTLGSPTRIARRTELLDDYWWIKGEIGYHMDVYSQEWTRDGIAINKGDTKSVYKCSFTISPQGLKESFCNHYI